MTEIIADRVKETTATTGTGTVTLAGAVSGFQSFSVVGNGNTCDYCLLSGNNTDWETGHGKYTSSGTTFSRDVVYASSNSGSHISLTGTSTIFLDFPATKFRVNSALPTSASTGLTTWGNQGSATVTDTPAGIAINAPSNGAAENWRIRYKTAPGTPFAIVAKVALVGDQVTNHHLGAGIGFFDGTKLQHLSLSTNSGSTAVLNYQTYNTYSSNASSSQVTSDVIPNPIYLAMSDDGSNIHFLYSVDGFNFINLVDHTLPDFLTVTDVYFGCNPYGSIAFATLMEWREYGNIGTAGVSGTTFIS